VIYTERRKILEGEDLHQQAQGFVADVVREVVETYCPSDVFPEDWDRHALLTALNEVFPVRSSADDIGDDVDADELAERLVQEALDAYEEKEASVGAEVMRELERVVLLNITDSKWREHLYEMDYLQEGIHLRAYAQKDPLTEYRREAFEMFEELTASIRQDFVKYIYRVELVRQDQQPQQRVERVQENRDEVTSGAAGAAAAPNRAAAGGDGRSAGNGGVGTRSGGNPQQAVSDKVPRNAPCPCGSGLKYKKCHGAATAPL
jgi:preprotein translocase subunit SecA